MDDATPDPLVEGDGFPVYVLLRTEDGGVLTKPEPDDGEVLLAFSDQRAAEVFVAANHLQGTVGILGLDDREFDELLEVIAPRIQSAAWDEGFVARIGSTAIPPGLEIVSRFESETSLPVRDTTIVPPSSSRRRRRR